MTSSPLAEASPNSLQDLFDKDPLLLTTEDVERIVTELRAQRDRWEITEAKPKKAKAAAPKNLTIEDLGL